MNTKQETIPLLQEKCRIHEKYQANLICLTAQCICQGFFCFQCSAFHEGHNIIQGQEFFETLKQLVCFDGYPKVATDLNSQSAKTISALLTIADELESLNQLFTQSLNTLKLQYERYNKLANDVVIVNNFILFASNQTENFMNYKGQFEECIKRLCFSMQKLQIRSKVQCTSTSLFVPDEKIYLEYLEPLIQMLKGVRLQAESSISKPTYFNKLDVSLKNNLQLFPNLLLEPIVFETDQPKEEHKILEKLWIDKAENQKKMQIMKLRPKEEISLDDEYYTYANGRLEKVFTVAGQKVWFLDFTYAKYRIPSKNGKFEPKQACIVCKCHPKFARINEYLNCKYGELYGPQQLDSRQIEAFRRAFDRRQNRESLIDRLGIYFHDLCVYWSSLVECDEKKGTIDFDSLAEAVRISQNSYCYLCKRLGATMKCNTEDCEISIHYYCWKELDPKQQFLDVQKFRMLCFQHASNKYQKSGWASQNLLLEDQQQLERKELRDFRQQTLPKIQHQDYGYSKYYQKFESQSQAKYSSDES